MIHSTHLASSGVFAAMMVGGCSPAAVEPVAEIPTDYSVIFRIIDDDNAEFLCESSAVESGSCVTAAAEYCTDQDKELLKEITVLTAKNGERATALASCYVPGKEIQ